MAIWEARDPLVRSFDDLDMEAAISVAEGGTEWKKITVFAELGAVSVTAQTIQNQGLDTVLPVTPGVVTITPGTANDTLAGTGAQVVQLRGVGAGFVGSQDPSQPWLEELVELNGLTPVPSANEYLRLIETRVVQAGSLRANDSVINMTIGGAVQTRIDPGVNVSKTSHVVIPSGYVGYADRISVNWDASDPVRVTCIVSFMGVDVEAFGARFERSLTVPIGATPLPPTADIWCTAARVGGGPNEPIDLTVRVTLHRLAA